MPEIFAIKVESLHKQNIWHAQINLWSRDKDPGSPGHDPVQAATERWDINDGGDADDE